ncbi:MAG: P-II family nitrogen regulator [Bacteroidota bacterium]
MTHHATKISIITEKLNEQQIEQMVVEAGAKGYTVFEGSGRGSHSLKTRSRPSVVDAFSLIKIEVIVADREKADAIVEKIASTYFKDYSGIVYMETVEILRLEKF